LPSWIYSRFDPDDNLTGFEFIKPGQARQKFADTSVSLQENYDKALQHRDKVLEDPDALKPAAKGNDTSLPGFIHPHKIDGQIVGYRVRVSSGKDPSNKAFTSTLFTPAQNLKQAKAHLATVLEKFPRPCVKEVDDLVPNEQLPKFIRFYKQRGKYGSDGYRVNAPDKKKTFSSSKLSMNEKLTAAKDFLAS